MEDKEQRDLEATICLKCGSQITHIPYRYNGQVFHARCLLCNACGRRLIGKPFITSGRQIFCGDECQEKFLKEKSPKNISAPPPPPPPTHVNQNQESNYSEDKQFVSTISLQDIFESMPGISRTTRPDLYSPPPLAPPSSATATTATMSRITDYPVSLSPSMSNRSHSFRSETDSISTLSESSFTSDSSSYTYDAQRKPKKKILKSSNAPKRRHKNRVRWNLNNLESVSDIDSVSLDSSNSYNYVPPTSHIHTQARDLTTRSLQNWRDYEYPLPPGSTGLTPNRRLSQSQQLLHTQPPPTRLQYKNNRTPLYRSYSGDITPSHNNRIIHHVLSADLHNHSSPLSSTPAQGVYPNGSVLNVPVFHLDEKNLPELDQSNLEERKRRHVFQIPQPSRTTTPLQTLQEDDKNDYDHLSPVHQIPPTTITNNHHTLTTQSTDQHQRDALPINQSLHQSGSSPPIRSAPPKKTSGSSRTAQELLAPAPTDEQWYSNEDIEEALQLIDDNDSPSDEELPPPIPPKQKGAPPPPPKRTSSISTMPPIESTDKGAVENTLHSPSMETLKNYESSSIDDDGLTPEVHPETTSSDLMFSWASSLKMKERIIEGAEDTHKNPSPVHINTALQSANSESHLPNTTTTTTATNSAQNSTLIRHNSLSPKASHKQSTDNSLLSKVHSSLHDLSTATSNDSQPIEPLTKEDEAVVQWMKQPRTMKPVVVDTDKEIEQMMAEIGGGKKTRRSTYSSSSLTRQKYFGTCCVCQKAIESSQSLFSFASRLYHSKCFACAQCGCPLRGKQIYTIKGTLVCTDDYNRITQSGSTHSLPSVALKKDNSKDPVLLQKIVHKGSHVTSNGDHVIHRHNSATMV